MKLLERGLTIDYLSSIDHVDTQEWFRASQALDKDRQLKMLTALLLSQPVSQKDKGKRQQQIDKIYTERDALLGDSGKAITKEQYERSLEARKRGKFL